MATGLFAARDLRRQRRAKLWHYPKAKRRVLKLRQKYDPLEGSPQATALVLEKREIEQKQPHSGMIKCVRIQIIKNGIQVTAHAPKSGAIEHIQEHDEVTVEGIGGSRWGPVGSIPGVKFRVVKVNGLSLDQLVKGKKKRAER